MFTLLLYYFVWKIFKYDLQNKVYRDIITKCKYDKVTEGSGLRSTLCIMSRTIYTFSPEYI